MAKTAKRPHAASISKALKQIKSGQHSGSVRIQLTLKSEVAVRLDSLRVETKSSSYSEVIREALRTYELLVKNRDCVYIREKNGELIRILLPK